MKRVGNTRIVRNNENFKCLTRKKSKSNYLLCYCLLIIYWQFLVLYDFEINDVLYFTALKYIDVMVTFTIIIFFNISKCLWILLSIFKVYIIKMGIKLHTVYKKKN